MIYLEPYRWMFFQDPISTLTLVTNTITFMVSICCMSTHITHTFPIVPTNMLSKVGNGAMTWPAQVWPYWLQSGSGMAECDTGSTSTWHIHL